MPTPGFGECTFKQGVKRSELGLCNELVASGVGHVRHLSSVEMVFCVLNFVALFLIWKGTKCASTS